MRPRDLLRRLFDAAVAAAAADRHVPDALPPPPRGRTLVVGAGKAAAAMARSAEEAWPGPLSGLVATRYGHGVPCRRIEVVEAGHPLPDGPGRDAGERMLREASRLGPDDLLLALWSGGGSSLIAVPGEGIPMADLRGVVDRLARRGVPIEEINVVRRHLSRAHGGRLARAAAPARIATLAISDVVGDDPATIASGPTSPDPSTRSDAVDVLVRHGVDVPPAVEAWLANPAAETPGAGDPAFARSTWRVVASARDAVDGARAEARRAGLDVEIVAIDVVGPSRAAAADHARRVLSAPNDRDRLWVSAGETTVDVRGSGTGGPNQEFALALALALDGAPGLHGLACDTDGLDGTSDAAGAIVTPDTLARARALGLDPARVLEDNDADRLFAALGDRVVTGPTRTNVNDLRLVLRFR